MVFVHGLGGDYAATWRYDQNSSWPHWLAEEFPEVGVWSLGYAASPTRLARVRGWFTGDRNAGYSMALPDRAGQVLDRMVQRHLGERPLFFICHSLGGLLVKQILRKADDADDDPRKKQVAAQTRAVLFLATPHNGAELATLLDAFQTLFGTTVTIDDLRAHDAHLLDLYNWYRNHSLDLGVRTVTYYERRPVMGVLPIVNATSSQAGVGPDAVALDEDHLSISKPRDRDEQVCDAARELLRDYVLARRFPTPKQLSSAVVTAAPEPQRLIVQVQTPGAGGNTVRIPCELPPAAEKHFGRQAELKQLTDRLRAGKNSAVVGPAGMGKTALAAQAVRAIVGETEAALAASPFPDGVVFVDLYGHQGKPEPAWNYLANALAGPGFMESSPAHDRAVESCRARDVLIIIEGGEEADGNDGRTTIPELSRVFSPQNRCLLLTRLITQSVPAETVQLKEALHPDDAAGLLDSLTDGRVTGTVREQVLALLEGHPLALTWAGGLLARGDDDPEQLVKEWEARGPGSLTDPTKAEHTLAWLFDRSVRGLDENERQLLEAAGLLARAPFPLAAMQSVLDSGAHTARDALKSLVQRGLLRRSEEPGHWEFTHVLGYRFSRKETGSDAALRERVGVWLSRHLHAVIANVGREHAVTLTRALEHAAALLRTDDGQKLWIPLANDLLYDIGDRLRDLGRLDLLGIALSGAGDWLARLPALAAQEPEWQRERLVLRGRRGDVLREQGDLDGALTAYRESLALIQELSETDPANAGWQRDLTVSHNKVGDVLREQGDLDRALITYRESLALRSRFAQSDPSNAIWQRDLSVNHNRIGQTLLQQGDLGGALTAYRESLALIERLALTDPSNADWQHDLCVNQEGIGEVLCGQGDLDGALTAYGESLALGRRLIHADPSNARWLHDLSYTLSRSAEIHERKGDLAKALPLAEESLEIGERLAALDCTNVQWQKDVAVSRDLRARLKKLLS